jgi:ATP synthase F1 epsilon subunit
MEDNFKLEIICPEKIIFSDEVKMVTLPSYEGDMSVLKHHISIITFLRPGIIKVQKSKGDFDEFFIQDGTVEYFNNGLVVLSASAINVKDLSKEFLDNLNKDTQEKLGEKDITDHDRYILNHKLDVLKEIRV